MSRISVTMQSETLAALCGLDRPWSIVRITELGDGMRKRVEHVVYSLQEVYVSPTRWDKTQRKWLDDREGKIRLSCHGRHVARYGELAVVAKIKETGSAEIKTSDGTRRCVLGIFYEREWWCVNCARTKVSERGGKIDWLFASNSV